MDNLNDVLSAGPANGKSRSAANQPKRFKSESGQQRPSPMKIIPEQDEMANQDDFAETKFKESMNFSSMRVQ